MDAPSVDEIFLNTIGSTQDVPIQLIVDMDNSIESKLQPSPLLDSSLEDFAPFIEVKPQIKKTVGRTQGGWGDHPIQLTEIGRVGLPLQTEVREHY